jgi:hypothetical protein
MTLTMFPVMVQLVNDGLENLQYRPPPESLPVTVFPLIVQLANNGFEEEAQYTPPPT